MVKSGKNKNVIMTTTHSFPRLLFPFPLSQFIPEIYNMNINILLTLPYDVICMKERVGHFQSLFSPSAKNMQDDSFDDCRSSPRETGLLLGAQWSCL